MEFANGKAAGKPEVGLICSNADLNHVLQDQGHEVLTIKGASGQKVLVSTSDKDVVAFHGQPDAVAVEVEVGGDGTAQVCLVRGSTLGPVKIKVKPAGGAESGFDCVSFRLIPRVTVQKTEATVLNGTPVTKNHKKASPAESKDQFRIPGLSIHTQAQAKGADAVEEGAQGIIKLTLEVVPEMMGKDTTELAGILNGLETKADNFKRRLIVQKSLHQAGFPQLDGEVHSGYRVDIETFTLPELADLRDPENVAELHGIHGTPATLLAVGSRTANPVFETPGNKSLVFSNSPMVPGREPGTFQPTDAVTVKVKAQIFTAATITVRSKAVGKATWCRSELDAAELVMQLRPVRPAGFVTTCPTFQ